MKLHFKKTGEGQPLLLLHGVFGMGDNLSSVAGKLSQKGFTCYLIDQRNHGRSGHADEFSYEAMANDLLETMDSAGIDHADMIGHSMGGKTAMFFALEHADRLRKMVVADIAPRYYPPHHQSILAAMQALPVGSLKSRNEAEEQMRGMVSDEGTIMFLLKNLYWETDERMGWRFNLPVIKDNIENIGRGLPEGSSIEVPTLFLKGERSGYINPDDETEIRKIFSDVQFRTIPGAGHWVHAENPEAFVKEVSEFLQRNS